jgi:hypothetical protein
MSRYGGHANERNTDRPTWSKLRGLCPVVNDLDTPLSVATPANESSDMRLHFADNGLVILARSFQHSVTKVANKWRRATLRQLPSDRGASELVPDIIHVHEL